MERFLEALATRLDGPAADGVDLKVNLVFGDVGETWVLTIENAVLHHRRRPPRDDADVTLELPRPLLLALLTGRADVQAVLAHEAVEVRGDPRALLRFLTLFRPPAGDFAIVTP